MLCFLLAKGCGISNPPFPQRSSGVLWSPTAQPHVGFHSTHHGLCCSLRAVPRLRGPFRVMEEIFLPHPPLPEGIHFRGGQCRCMAYRRNRIPVRYSEEGIQRVALGVVLHQRRCPPGPNLAWSSQSFLCSFKEVRQLASPKL